MITGSDTTTLDIFEEKFQRFVAAYQILKAENASLRQSVADGINRENDLQKRYDALKTDYENLKTTKVLSVSGRDLDSTQKRVAGLVREIDRCIDMLKV